MSAVLERLRSVAPMSDQLMEHLSEHLKHREIPKKYIWLHKDHICRNIAFIEKGLFRCYYEKHNTEISSWFMAEGDIMISVNSFFKQVPSREYIEALEDAYISYLDYRDLENTYQLFPEFREHDRLLTRYYYILAENRLESIRMMRAPERYENLRQEFPHFIDRIPAKYLASYLGIAEATLSRIKTLYNRCNKLNRPHVGMFDSESRSGFRNP